MRRVLVLLALCTGGMSGAQALPSVAGVQKLPLLHDPDAPVAKQLFTAQERNLISGVARAVNARREFQAFLAKHGASPINSNHVLLSFVAPFRSAVAERLTVFPVFSGDAAWLVFAFGEGNRVQVYASAGNGGPFCAWTQAYTVKDLNADGRREVAVVQACADGPGGASALHLYGAGPGGFQFWGFAELTSHFGGDHRWSMRSSRLFVRKGRTFEVYAVRRLEEGFYQGGYGRENLRLTEEGVAVVRVHLRISPEARQFSLIRLF
ncbi:hypothetical protein [Deinococcus ficus]|uniref:hypothetical protein n=1 Tax=Deinococcus ficus TaxID=317577 RepID=UPI0003B326A2|nr:hypothetical protein [Deinococcus ficus]